MATVYCHINKINNKKYVGITSSSAERRWGINGSGYKGSYFYEHGIEAFGWDGFIHLILLDDISTETAEQLEARLIKMFNLTDKDFGYNDAIGAKIYEDNEIDVLAQRLGERILNTNKRQQMKSVPPVDYSFSSRAYGIDYLVNLNNTGFINTDLDCQRGYVWTEERQQGMWDTLLRGHRIPECHAIQSSKNGMPLYEIIDGKQRLTTILKIVNNEIPFNKKNAAKLYYPLFGEKSLLYYEELPEELKNRILTTSINFAIYNDINDDDLVILFRKLNASAPLSDFSKGIASCITMRTRFTRYILKHPTIKELFKEQEARKSEDELFLIRLMFLLKYGYGVVNLQPTELNKKYDDIVASELVKYRDIILAALDKYRESAQLLRKLKAKNSFLPIIFYYFIKNDISELNATEFLQVFIDNVPSVRGEDFVAKYQIARYNLIDEYFSY